MGAYYRSWYEQDDFEEDVKRLFDELSPLYDQLHAYVRRKLRDKYGSDKFPKAGHIPAHIFGILIVPYVTKSITTHYYVTIIILIFSII